MADRLWPKPRRFVAQIANRVHGKTLLGCTSLPKGECLVARLRYSRAEAQAEATRRAEAFVAARPDRDQWRHRGTVPNTLVPSRTSKHSVAWVAVFASQEGRVEGGELFVAVDLASGSVTVDRSLEDC